MCWNSSFSGHLGDSRQMLSWTVPVALVIVAAAAMKETCLITALDGMVIAAGVWDSSFRCPSWSKGWLVGILFEESLMVGGPCGFLSSCTASSAASGPCTRPTTMADLSSSFSWRDLVSLVIFVAKEIRFFLLVFWLTSRSSGCLFAFLERLGNPPFGFEFWSPATAALVV